MLRLARCTTTSHRKSTFSPKYSSSGQPPLGPALLVIPHKGLTPRKKLTEALHRSVRAFQHQPQLARLIASLELSSDPFATEILERMDQTTSSVYMELLEGVEPRRARTIVRTVDAVLDSQLRAWSAGRLPITGLYDYLSESIDLMFEGDPDIVDDTDPYEPSEVVSFGGDGAR